MEKCGSLRQDTSKEGTRRIKDHGRDCVKNGGGKAKKGSKTYRILAIDGIPTDTGVEGYLDDGSGSYKRFLLDSDGELHIMAEYPKSKYGDEYMFSQIMGKFDPEVFFMKEPVEVECMDLDTLLNVYWNNYGG